MAGGARATKGEGTETDEKSTAVGVFLYKRLFRQVLHDVGMLCSGERKVATKHTHSGVLEVVCTNGRWLFSL